MKKSFAFICVFTLFLSIVFANGTRDVPTDLPEDLKTTKEKLEALNRSEPIELRGGITVQVENIEVLPDGAYIVAHMIKMKADYERDVFFDFEYPLDLLQTGFERLMDDGKSIYRITPISNIAAFRTIDNLDIFVWHSGKRLPIQKYKLLINVSVPSQLLIRGDEKHIPSYRTIFVFHPFEEGSVEGAWIPITNPKSGVISVNRSSEAIDFVINEWPVNDKMICSGP